MTTKTKKAVSKEVKKGEWKEKGGFAEEFINLEEGESFVGIYDGTTMKKIDGDERTFAIFIVEGKSKPQILGGADLVNKLEDTDQGAEVRVTYVKKETFTPKGSKKKLPIRRFRVEEKA